MSNIRVNDTVHWIADDESTKCSGELKIIEDDAYIVEVDEEFWAIESENMNPEHEILLDVSDLIEAHDD